MREPGQRVIRCVTSVTRCFGLGTTGTEVMTLGVGRRPDRDSVRAAFVFDLDGGRIRRMTGDDKPSVVQSYAGQPAQSGREAVRRRGRPDAVSFAMFEISADVQSTRSRNVAQNVERRQ